MLKLKVDDSSPAYDIAKERYEPYVVGKGYDIWLLGASVITNKPRSDCTKLMQGAGAPWEQIRLMAAAPELADLMREAINYATAKGQTSNSQNAVFKNPIKLLRKLGIPNVAPWFKE